MVHARAIDGAQHTSRQMDTQLTCQVCDFTTSYAALTQTCANSNCSVTACSSVLDKLVLAEGWRDMTHTCAPCTAAKYAAVRPAAPPPMTTTDGPDALHPAIRCCNAGTGTRNAPIPFARQHASKLLLAAFWLICVAARDGRSMFGQVCPGQNFITDNDTSV